MPAFFSPATSRLYVDPSGQAPEVALALAAVRVGVLPRVVQLLLRDRVDAAASSVEALGVVEDAVAAVTGLEPSLGARHGGLLSSPGEGA